MVNVGKSYNEFSIILNEFMKVRVSKGRKRENHKKNHLSHTPASRTWLVSHVPSVGLSFVYTTKHTTIRTTTEVTPWDNPG